MAGQSPAMTKEGNGVIEVETNLNDPRPEDGYRLYAQGLQVWRLCDHASCRRFADWAEAVKDTAQRERDARDPKSEALRSELGQRLFRLAETLRDEP